MKTVDFLTIVLQIQLLFDESNENVFSSLYKSHKAKLLKINKNTLEGLLYGDHLFG